MIVGVGNDVVNIGRIEKTLKQHGERFIQRVFTEYERRYAEGYKLDKARHAYFAKRFAAKEACAKALGSGFRQGVSFKDIGVIQGKLHKPEILLSGCALEALHRLIPAGSAPHIHLALSDDYPFAFATVIISIE